jgi:diaminohydroxyphosphoribosylaminopyrimidine deaminase/5-amino-6-(5-phosphoribosylamino)uracil reductase
MEQNYKKYIRRCIDIALNGKGKTQTNPIVGSVIVYNDEVIGEGYHKEYGGAHAEVNAINSVKDKSLLRLSTLYVSLEPCSHMGKTPPCSDLIVEKGIPKVVIGSIDPNSLVAGKGIEKLKKANIEVVVDVLTDECMDINRRFFTFHSKKRPFIILKWAESADGFIDIEREADTPIGPNWISNPISRLLVHKWRSEENAIMVGTNTASLDNPTLTTRLWPGNSPVRIVLDRTGRLSTELNVFSQEVLTIIFTSKDVKSEFNREYVKIDFKINPIGQIVKHLWEREIQSVIIEGGRTLLQSFIDLGLWDEARVFVGRTNFINGVVAPQISNIPLEEYSILNDRLLLYKNR